jgi:putative transposase
MPTYNQTNLDYFTYEDNRKEILFTRITKYIDKILCSVIDFKMGSNCNYSNLDTLSVLVHAAKDNFCVEDSSEGLRDPNNLLFPSGETVLYHIKKYDNNEILELFNKVNSSIFKLAKRKGSLHNKVDVAIDCTDELYYGNKNASMVVGRKHKNGTSKAYRFATLSIVEKDQRFILAAFPVSAFTNTKTMIKYLLKYASTIVKIKNVYLDRGFFSVDAIATLTEMKAFYYVMPAIKNSKIKKMAQQFHAPHFCEYTMGTKSKNTTLNLAFIEDPNNFDDKRIFATNLPLEKLKDLDLSKIYRKRWGIETGYRMRNVFRARTTSKNYKIRLFLFMLSVCLYNLWVLTKLSIRITYFINEKNSIITAKNFASNLDELLKSRAWDYFRF